MSFDYRAITNDEVPAFRSGLSRGFGHNYNPAGDDRFIALMPLDRTVAAFEGDAIVGTLGDFPLQLTVPGGAQIPMAGTTMVTVEATHTRRGILRSLMRVHLDNAVERNEPVAGLWASEPGIYGRFGFGLATELHSVRIDNRQLAPIKAAEDITLRLIAPDTLFELIAPFWSSIGQQRAGFVDRGEPRWNDLAADPEWSRDGATEARHLVAERHGKVVGYLAYRQQSKWDDMGADGTIVVNALIGQDLDAELALWGYALNVDLFPNVASWTAPTDDALAYCVSNARAIRRTVLDGLYVRVLDVPAALTSRTYEHDGEITIQIADDMDYANGTYHLQITGGTASVAPTDDEPDVRMDIRELGALYLGRACARLYERTGHLVGTEDSIGRLSMLFGASRAPYCLEMF